MKGDLERQAPRVADDLSLVAPVERRQPRRDYEDLLEPCADLILPHDPQHPRSEAIRGLRTKLLLDRDETRHAGTLAVLSPSAGEGRSQLCAELAIAFAQLGRPTLLVDADFRSPRQHVLFGDENPSGLAQTLARGEPPRMHGIRGVPEMSLLTSGGQPPNPLELLSGDRFAELLAAWQGEHDFVIIDTPPLARYSDGIAIASAARRALIVTRAPATSFAALKEMTRHLAAAPLRVVGAVINTF